jgi:putative tryptophan/tyrosine transport system substrate-binding protein
MRRREFVTLLGCAATWPRVTRAQQPAMPVIGLLSSASPDLHATRARAFRQGLSATGYVEGQNVTIEYRWANGQFDRLPAMAAELANRDVTVIASLGGNAPAMASKAATSTIPIVFMGVGGDPIELGLVASLHRPGGNLTGATVITGLLGAKRLQLLLEVIPKPTLVGILMNPTNPTAKTYVVDAQEAARSLGQQIHIINASGAGEIDAAFATFAHLRVGALLVITDAFFITRRDQLVALADRYGIPAIYENRDFVDAGGLMSYGPDLADVFRNGGIYTGRVLKGEKPAELPVIQAAKFEFVLNVKTAKALGITLPPTLLARADEVIE